MKILMVYEMVPETAYTYVLDGVSPEDWEWMKLTHGRYVNGHMSDVETEACDRLSTYLEGKQRTLIADGTETVDSSPVMLRGENFDYFIHTGFIL